MEQEREHRRCGRSYNRSSEAGIVDNEGMYQVILKRRVLAPLAGKLELYLLRINFRGDQSEADGCFLHL